MKLLGEVAFLVRDALAELNLKSLVVPLTEPELIAQIDFF